MVSTLNCIKRGKGKGVLLKRDSIIGRNSGVDKRDRLDPNIRAISHRRTDARWQYFHVIIDGLIARCHCKVTNNVSIVFQTTSPRSQLFSQLFFYMQFVCVNIFSAFYDIFFYCWETIRDEVLIVLKYLV